MKNLSKETDKIARNVLFQNPIQNLVVPSSNAHAHTQGLQLPTHMKVSLIMRKMIDLQAQFRFTIVAEIYKNIR